MFGKKREGRSKTVRWALHKAPVENNEVWLPENSQAVGITIERVPFRKKDALPDQIETEVRSVFHVHYLVPEE